MKIYEQKYFFCKTVSPFFAYPYFSKPWPRLIKHICGILLRVFPTNTIFVLVTKNGYIIIFDGECSKLIWNSKIARQLRAKSVKLQKPKLTP